MNDKATIEVLSKDGGEGARVTVTFDPPTRAGEDTIRTRAVSDMLESWQRPSTAT